MRATVHWAQSLTISWELSAPSQRLLKSTTVRSASRSLNTCARYVSAFCSICSRESAGRVSLRPVGSPIIPVKSPIRKITWWPRSWKCLSFRSSTVWPRCRSGAVGSKPAFTRSGRPAARAASRRASSSRSVMISTAPLRKYASCSSAGRNDIAVYYRTRSLRAPSMDLSVDIAGVRLENPVLAASGTFGYGTEFEDIVNLRGLGGIVTKGLSRAPMAGNPSPRLCETAAGMLNSVGLQNIGAEAFVRDRLPRLRQLGVLVIANIFGESVEDYVAVIETLNQGEGIAAYELNASCPNTRRGGMVFGTDPVLLAELVSAAKAA